MIAQPSPAAPPVPSSRRPIPLMARRDLVTVCGDYQENRCFVIKDPIALKYVRLEPEQQFVLTRLDGRTSLEDIRDALTRQFPASRFALADIQHLVTDLHRQGLLVGQRPGQGDQLRKRRREERRRRRWLVLRNILFLRLPGWDPHRLLRALLPVFGWLFRPWAVAAAALLVLATWLLLLVQFAEFRAGLPEFGQYFSWPNLFWLWVTIALCKIAHEFGHGLTCVRYGAECHEMGVMLLLFSPSLYCDVTDSWTLRSKWQRIAIAAAGMYVELILSAFAILLVFWTRPGLVHHLALNVFFVTSITTVIFNLNPLMRLDGYYILADLLEIPNLREKADRLLREVFARQCLGIELSPDPFAPRRHRAWFVLYAVASAIYRWLLLFGICLFLYTVLKPYRLQSLGVALAVLSATGAVAGLAISVCRILATPRSEPMSRRRLVVTLAALTAAATGVLVLPLPLHVEATFVVQPEGVRHVYTSTSGRLEKVFVSPGDRVCAGQQLAQLSNDDLDAEFWRLRTEIGRQRSAVLRHRHLEDRAQEHLASERLDRLEEQLDDLLARKARLVICAPIEGTVVAAPRRPQPKRSRTERRLHVWHGTPLDPQNLGAYLEEQTHLLSIAPSDRAQAILIVDQTDRNDLSDVQEVEIKLEHMPERTYVGRIQKVSLRQLEFAPEALSNKHGGALPTVTDREGRERLPDSAYQATVLLPEASSLLRPGLRGEARFLVSKRSAGEWLWRAIQQTFHFRL